MKIEKSQSQTRHKKANFSKVLKGLSLVFVLMIALTVFAACNKEKDKYWDNISELRTDVFKHSDDNFAITAMSGYRETHFSLDGIAHKKVEFTVVTVVPASALSADTGVEYAIKIGEDGFSGSMLKHPFNESFSIEVPRATNGASITISVTAGENTTSTELVTQFTSEMIDYQRAFEIAQKRLKDKFDALTVDKKLKAEIFIRFIENPLNTSGGYFWYVALVDSAHNTYAVLIDPINENILAER